MAAAAALGGAVDRPAAARAAFTVSPTIIDVRAARGTAISRSFEVSLRGERRRFTIVAEALGQDAHGGFTFGPPGRRRFSAATWITARPSTFSGAPDRVQPVEIDVRVPPDAEPGDHPAALTVRRAAAAQPGRAAIVQAVAVRLTIRVQGRLRRSARLTGLRFPRIADGGPLDAAVDVRNDGNVRLDFDRADRGALTIASGGRARTSTPFTGVLYPGEQREFRASWLDPPLVGAAHATARIGAVARARTALLLPWRQALALVLVAVAAILLVTGRRRRAVR
jgi:hypothetical protein